MPPSRDDVLIAYATPQQLTGERGGHIHVGSWRPGGPERRLEDAQHAYVEALTRPLNLAVDQRLLDLGCGEGAAARQLARSVGCEVHGIDLVPDQIAAAQQVARDQGCPGVHFAVGDIVSLPFPDGHFQAAMSLETLLHLHDRREAFAEIARCLAPGARLAVSDYVLDPSASWFDRSLAQSATGTKYLGTIGSYLADAEAAGLVCEAHEDVTEKTISAFYEWSTQERHAHVRSLLGSMGGAPATMLAGPSVWLLSRAIRRGGWRLVWFWFRRGAATEAVHD